MVRIKCTLNSYENIHGTGFNTYWAAGICVGPCVQTPEGNKVGAGLEYHGSGLTKSEAVRNALAMRRACKAAYRRTP